MFKLLRGWFRSFGRFASGADEPSLRAEREAQVLRLELQERDRFIAELKADYKRVSRDASESLDAGMQTFTLDLLTHAAAPVAQLYTLAHLLEVEGKPLQARDVLVVARRLVRVLEDLGLAPAGRIGETVAFDPDRHEPLASDFAPRPGQTVVVRLVGVNCQGRVLSKAAVGPAGE